MREDLRRNYRRDLAKPGALHYGSTGIGGITHFATELFDLMAGTRMTHVPFTGTGPAVNGLLGGHIQRVFGSAPIVDRASACLSFACHSSDHRQPRAGDAGYSDGRRSRCAQL